MTRSDMSASPGQMRTSPGGEPGERAYRQHLIDGVPVFLTSTPPPRNACLGPKRISAEPRIILLLGWAFSRPDTLRNYADLVLEGLSAERGLAAETGVRLAYTSFEMVRHHFLGRAERFARGLARLLRTEFVGGDHDGTHLHAPDHDSEEKKLRVVLYLFSNNGAFGAMKLVELGLIEPQAVLCDSLPGELSWTNYARVLSYGLPSLPVVGTLLSTARRRRKIGTTVDHLARLDLTNQKFLAKIARLCKPNKEMMFLFSEGDELCEAWYVRCGVAARQKDGGRCRSHCFARGAHVSLFLANKEEYRKVVAEFFRSVSNQNPTEQAGALVHGVARL